jgi:hypothetical protein
MLKKSKYMSNFDQVFGGDNNGFIPHNISGLNKNHIFQSSHLVESRFLAALWLWKPWQGFLDLNIYNRHFNKVSKKIGFWKNKFEQISKISLTN